MRDKNLNYKYELIPYDFSEESIRDIKLNFGVNMVDKAKIYIPKKYLPKEKIRRGKCPHMKWGNEHKNFFIEFSGRIFSKPFFLGGLYEDNVNELQEYIKKNIGIDVPIEALISSKVVLLDIKQDMLFPCTSVHEFEIARMREMIPANTNKSELHSFIGKVGFQNSILVKSTTKTIKDSLTIYLKLVEMYVNRKDDDGYYNSFDKSFLEEVCKNIIRFERRIKRASNLRKALHLDNKATVCLKNVFAADFNIIQEKVSSVLGIDFTDPSTSEKIIMAKTPAKYIEELGFESIISICKNNLEIIKAHLKREYPNKDIRYIWGKIKKYMVKKDKQNNPKSRENIIDILKYNFRLAS